MKLCYLPLSHQGWWCVAVGVVRPLLGLSSLGYGKQVAVERGTGEITFLFFLQKDLDGMEQKRPSKSRSIWHPNRKSSGFQLKPCTPNWSQWRHPKQTAACMKFCFVLLWDISEDLIYIASFHFLGHFDMIFKTPGDKPVPLLASPFRHESKGLEPQQYPPKDHRNDSMFPPSFHILPPFLSIFHYLPAFFILAPPSSSKI